jgi:hypothetical protein
MQYRKAARTVRYFEIKMKKSIFTIGALLLATSSYASNWVSIVDDPTEEVFVDMQSMRSDGKGIVRAWLKMEFRQPEKIANGNIANSKVVKWTLNCKSYQFAGAAGAFYDAEGKSIGSWNAPIKYNEIIPDSIGDSIANTLCMAVKR